MGNLWKFARGEKGVPVSGKSFRRTSLKNQKILSFKSPGIMFSLKATLLKTHLRCHWKGLTKGHVLEWNRNSNSILQPLNFGDSLFEKLCVLLCTSHPFSLYRNTSGSTNLTSRQRKSEGVVVIQQRNRKKKVGIHSGLVLWMSFTKQMVLWIDTPMMPCEKTICNCGLPLYLPLAFVSVKRTFEGYKQNQFLMPI